MSINTMFRLIILVTLALTTSCTAKQIYSNIQQDHQRRCHLLPIWQQEHCLSLNDTTWENYVRERHSNDNTLPEDYWLLSEGSGDNSP